MKKILYSILVILGASSALERNYVRPIEKHTFGQMGLAWVAPNEFSPGLGFNYAKWAEFWAQNEDGFAFDARAKVLHGGLWPSLILGVDQYTAHHSSHKISEVYGIALGQWGRYHLGASGAFSLDPLDTKASIGAGINLWEHLQLNFESIYEDYDLRDQAMLEFETKYLKLSSGFSVQHRAYETGEDPYEYFAGIRLRMPFGAEEDEEDEYEKIPTFSEHAPPPSTSWEERLRKLEERVALLEASPRNPLPTENHTNTPNPKYTEHNWNLKDWTRLGDLAAQALQNPAQKDEFQNDSKSQDFLNTLALAPYVSQGLRPAKDKLSEATLEHTAYPPLPQEKEFFEAIQNAYNKKEDQAIVWIRQIADKDSLKDYPQAILQSPWTSPSTRQGMTKLLSLSKNPQDLNLLRSLLDDRDPQVKSLALEALGEQKDINSAKKMGELLKNDPNPKVQKAAQNALEKILGDLGASFKGQEKTEPKHESKEKKKTHSTKKSQTHSMYPDKKRPAREIYSHKGSKSKHQSPKFEPITGHELEDSPPPKAEHKENGH